MNEQINALMDLVAAKFQATEHDSHGSLRTALEAALKPGEPVTWAEAEAIAIRPSVEDAIEALLADQTLDNATGVVMAVLKAAPPAQTDPLTVKLKDDWRTDDWGAPIIYDTDEVDEVTGALTGDEGEDDSLTVLRSMAAYVQNVWPGKTALQVLTECEEAMQQES